MKVLFCCDSNGTGFSSAGSTIINELLKISDWDIHLFAINMFLDENTIKEKTIKVYNIPKEKIYVPLLPYNVTNQTHPFNKEIISTSLYGCYNIGKVCERVNPDVLILFNDLYPIEWLYKNVMKSKWKGKVIAYLPIDCEINKGTTKAHYGIDKIIATTKHGAECIKNTGYKKSIDVVYHPVKDTFSILPENLIKEYKEKLMGKKHLNKFIVLNSNKNQYRKRQDLTIEGFSIFAKGKDDVALFLKCEMCDDNEHGRYNIKKLLEESITKHGLDTENKIIINSENITYEEINILYNICDIGLSTTSGEGFGYIPVEFARLNKPFLVSNNTSYPELFDGYAGLIPCVKSIPIASMNNSIEVKSDASMIVMQCYLKKYPDDESDIVYIQSFDNQVIENYNISDVNEFTTLMNNLSKNKNLILFQVSTPAGDKLSNYKKIIENIKLPKWLLDRYRIAMLDKNVFKVIYDSHQLNSYIPTAQTVADKLEEFYQIWKSGNKLPLATLPKEIEKDYIAKQFKTIVEDVFKNK